MLNAVILTILAVVYSPIIIDLYNKRWDMIDYTHAYFILPISIWIAWRKRDEIKNLVKGYSLKLDSTFSFSLFLLVLGLSLLIFGYRQQYLAISSFSLIPVLFGLSGYLYGGAVAKALSFPILYLLLMIPPPLGLLDSLTIPMRYGVSIATEFILRGVGYPLVRNGLILNLGGHEIYMGAPCSGFRSLITMISLGLVYVYISKGTFLKKTVLFLSVIPIALVGNLLRVLGICLTTYHLGEPAGKVFHDWSGYAIFLVLIACMLGLETLMNKFKWFEK